MENRDEIHLTGVNVNNLKNINIAIPKNEIVVFTGVSGSGKSSLVFDTIAAESQRQMNLNYPMYLRRRMILIERPDADQMENLTFAIVIDQKALGGGVHSTVGTALDLSALVRLLFSRVGIPSAGEASHYMRTDPIGMCPDCSGLGRLQEINESSLFNMDGTVAGDGLNFKPIANGWQKSIFVNSGLFDVNKPLKDFTDEEWTYLTYGPDEVVEVSFPSNKTGQVFTETYEGFIPRFKRLYVERDISRLSQKVQDETNSKLILTPCKRCGGSGYSKAVLNSKINGYNLVDYNQMELNDLSSVLESIHHPLGSSIAAQIKKTIDTSIQAGIGYLSLNRRVDTLSGGERQRVKMVGNLGSSLNNATYILDEPTAGMHPADVEKVKHLLTALRDDFNSVLVVEHNPEIMKLANRIVDIGPGAGSHGGTIVYQGSYEGLLKADTKTAHYLKTPVTPPKETHHFTEFLTVENATTNNLKNITVHFPIAALTAISGVAGSGKSSLMEGDFMTKYPNAILIDQGSIGISSRSTPATYVNIMDNIRQLFSNENQIPIGMFSFNSTGACPICQGKGVTQPDVAFADPISITCQSCKGTRYSNKARSYKYRNKNIVEVLCLTVDEALVFFNTSTRIKKRLSLLQEVGLGYLTLGQTTSTLSGGELQRLKLALEFQKVGNIYVLDEPTNGLHMADIEKLIHLLKRLIKNGNTVIVIEHDLQTIASADWVIDLGPSAGREGGELIFQGSPKNLLDCTKSSTAKYLKQALSDENQ